MAAGDIYAVAGNGNDGFQGEGGFSGDGGRATAAEFIGPIAVAADGAAPAAHTAIAVNERALIVTTLCSHLYLHITGVSSGFTSPAETVPTPCRWRSLR